MHWLTTARWGAAAAIAAIASAGTPAPGAGRCDQLLTRLGAAIADAVCFESADLTTNNPATTPLDNSLPGLPQFAFTPQTDRAVISPPPGSRTPITKIVPGIQ